MMKLPFLKKRKLPRIAEPIETKLVNGSSDDHIDDHMLGELIDAYDRRDVKLFRQALEALIMNMMDWDGEQDGNE